MEKNQGKSSDTKIPYFLLNISLFYIVTELTESRGFVSDHRSDPAVYKLRTSVLTFQVLLTKRRTI